MKVGQAVRELIEKISGRKVFKILPFGFDPIYDIHRKVRDYKFHTVFDVGANIGQTALELSRKLPDAKIYSFEPSADSFETLKQNMKGKKNVHLFRLALGNERKHAKMVKSSRSDMNRILEPGTEMSTVAGNEVEDIEMETLSGFCAANAIDHISYLKIDTEGFDLEVLKSGNAILAERKVDFVEVEVSMNNTNRLHVPFAEVTAFLGQHHYQVFGIYEQTQEWLTGKPMLRRSNVVFISDRFL